MAYAVISVVGHDRPGFVRELAALALDRALNIEDTRATALGTEFAVLMGVTGDEVGIDAMETALAAQQEIAYVLRRCEPRSAPSGPPTTRISVLAMDHPGIVHSVSAFFADRGLSIAELNTETRHAPHTGTPMFDLTMEISEPGDGLRLRQEFLEFCEDRDLDGNMETTL